MSLLKLGVEAAATWGSFVCSRIAVRQYLSLPAGFPSKVADVLDCELASCRLRVLREELEEAEVNGETVFVTVSKSLSKNVSSQEANKSSWCSSESVDNVSHVRKCGIVMVPPSKQSRILPVEGHFDSKTSSISWLCDCLLAFSWVDLFNTLSLAWSNLCLLCRLHYCLGKRR